MKKISIFVLTLILALGCTTTAFAMEYGNTFPNYVKYSGGCYIEVSSSVGQGTIVVPNQFKNDTFSFYNRTGFNIINCTNSTVSGRFIFRNGSEYMLRFSSFGTCEIRQNNSSYQWQPVTINSILNTNCFFMDNTDSDRQTDERFVKYDFSFKEQFYIGFSSIAVFLILGSNYLYYMRNRGY